MFFVSWLQRLCLKLCVICFLLWALMLALAGCRSATEDGAGAVSQRREECVALWQQAQAAVDGSATHGVTGVVYDVTSSVGLKALTSTEMGLLRGAQARGDQVIFIGVNGADAAPLMSPPVYLDPEPGRDSVNAKEGREMLLSCLPDLMPVQELVPTSPGSDILAALSHAARQHPSTLLVRTDGISTAGVLDLGKVGYDAPADQVVAQLKAASALPDLRGVSVTLSGVGETSGKPLPETARDGLRRLWEGILTATGAEKVTFESATGGRPTQQLPERPSDPVPAAEPVTVTMHGATCVAVPSALLFLPDQATLNDAEELRRIAAALKAREPDVIRVVGHAANLGGDTHYRARLSRERAQAVADFLRAQGLSSRFQVIGAGADDPPSTHPAKDRRVDIIAGTTDQVNQVDGCQVR